MLILNGFRDLPVGLLVGVYLFVAIGLIVGYAIFFVKVLKALVKCIVLLLCEEDCHNPESMCHQEKPN